MAPLLDSLMRLALRWRKRPGKPSGVLLVTSRGPAEMVFLAAVLPRFLRLAEPDEDVTLLMRPDAAGMSFLFPRGLRILRADFRHLGDLSTRWSLFRKLYRGHYRLVVSLDYRRDPAGDEALIAATLAPEMAAMEEAPSAHAARLLDTCRAKYGRLFPSGPVRQDKILRWSRFADFLLGTRHPPALALMPGHRLPDAMRFEVPTVVLFPFSAVRGRQVLPQTWELILNALPAGWQARIAGHQIDFDRNPQFKPLLERPRVSIDTSGFDHLASVLRGARMVVGADTAGVHLAILLGVPTLVLASAAYVGAGVPYDEAIAPANAHFLFTPMECQGCLGHCPFEPVQGMLPCVARLDPAAILETIADMQARGGF